MIRWIKGVFGTKKRVKRRATRLVVVRSSRWSAGRKRIGDKVRFLIVREGREPKQAVAIAYAMAREGKLGAGAAAYARRTKRR